MIRMFLNGNFVVNPPDELKHFEESLQLSDEIKGYVYQIGGSFTFYGEDFDYIYSLYKDEYCQDIEVIIQRNPDGYSHWNTIARGIIRLSGVTFDLVREQCTCSVNDNSYLSKIDNNKSIEFMLGPVKDSDGIVLSKNGVDITDRYVIHENVELFSPLTERYFQEEATYSKTSPPFSSDDGVGDVIDLRPSSRRGMFIYDALNLIIGQMTDGEVGFESDYFSYNIATFEGRPEAWGVLMSGGQIRFGSNLLTGIIVISFDELFSDLHKLFNVWFSLEISSSGQPIVRVEEEDYFRQSVGSVYFESISELTESIKLEQIYARLLLGCSKQDTSFPVEDTPLILHIQEEYGLTGTCNTDNTLDLRLSKLIINTNSIALVLPPISGFNTGDSIIRKYTTEETTAGSGGHNQLIIDSSADFVVKSVEHGFILQNTVNKDYWTYITGIVGNDKVLTWDISLDVDNTGAIKNYEIFKPALFDSYDTEVFLIQIKQSIPDGLNEEKIYAEMQNIPIAELSYYNPLYTNYLTIERHLGGLAQDIITAISDGNDEFNSEKTATTTISSLELTNYEMYRRVIFDDDFTGPAFFDTNNNYDNTNGKYIVPQAGYYHAQTALEVGNGSTIDGGIDLTYQVELVQFSETGQLKDTIAAVSIITHLSTAVFNLEKTFYCDKNDIICVVVKKPYNQSPGGTYPRQYIEWSVNNTMLSCWINSTFGINELFNGGGVLTPSDTADVRIVNIDAKGALSHEDFETIKSNPFKYYHIHYGENRYVSGYIKNITRGIENGQTTATLFKKRGGV